MYTCQHCGAELNPPSDLISSMKIVRMEESQVHDDDHDIADDKTAKYSFKRFIKCPSCKKGTAIDLTMDD